MSDEKIIDLKKKYGWFNKNVHEVMKHDVKLENVGELSQASQRVQYLLLPPLSYFLLGGTLANQG